MEDVFDQQADEREVLQRTLVLESQRFYKMGFRDGLFEAKQQSVQAGFDEGFACAARLVVELGYAVEEARAFLQQGSLEKVKEALS